MTGRPTSTSEERLDRCVSLEKEAYDYFAHQSEQASNELAKQTFQVLAERHNAHADHLEHAYREHRIGRPPQIELPPAVKSLFNEIVRQIEQSSAVSRGDVTLLYEALMYATKLRDSYEHFILETKENWEQLIYGSMKREEDTLRATLADTLNYLRSNLTLARMPKQSS